MNVLVVGLGSIGRRHLRNLRRLLPSADITVWRRRPNGEAPPAEADRVVFGLDEALAARPRAAVVAGPASSHVETARPLAEAGVHLLIEKPIAHGLDGVDALIGCCRARGLVLMVGYSLRFYRPLELMRAALRSGRIGRLAAVEATVGHYLPDWRPGRDYRETVSARAELGGGAVLELSHEIDSVRWLAGEVTAVTGRLAKISDLEIDVEDTADLVLELDSGVTASLHLDMVQRVPVRNVRLTGETGVLTLDLRAHELRHQVADSGAWSTLHAAPRMDLNEAYVDELRHFLDCVEAGGAPRVGADDGRRVLEIALAAKRASRERRRIVL